MYHYLLYHVSRTRNKSNNTCFEYQMFCVKHIFLIHVYYYGGKQRGVKIESRYVENKNIITTKELKA